MSDNLNTPQLLDNEPAVVVAAGCDQSSKSGLWTITNLLMILLLVLSLTGIVLRVITPRRVWPPSIIQDVLLRCAVVDTEIRSVASTHTTSGIIVRVLKLQENALDLSNHHDRTLHSGVLPFVRSWKKRYGEACALEAEMDDIEAIPEVQVLLFRSATRNRPAACTSCDLATANNAMFALSQFSPV